LNYYFKYLTLATVILSLIPLFPCLSLSPSPIIVAQTQTRLQRIEEASRLIKLGGEQLEKRQFQEALESHQKALVIFREIGEKGTEALVLFFIGKIYNTLGQYPTALESLQQTLAIVKETGDKKIEGLALRDIGLVYYNLKQYPKALESFQQALAIIKDIDDQGEKWPTLIGIGQTYYNLGQYRKALEFQQQALAITKAIGNQELESLTLSAIGLTYGRMSQYSQALSFFQKSLAIAKQLDDKASVGATLNLIGEVYNQLGQYPKALEFHQQAFAIAKSIRDKSLEGATLDNIGFAYINLGQYPKALEFYQQALALRQEAGNKQGEANTFRSIGEVYDEMGQYSKALQFYEQTLTLYQKISDSSEEASTLNSFGTVYSNLGQYPKALKFHEQALALLQKTDDKSEKADTLLNIGAVYRNLGQYPKALEFYQQALALRQETDDEVGKAATFNSLGLLYTSQGQYPKALEFYQQALAIVKEIGNKAWEGRNLNNIGLLYQSLAQYPKALEFYQQALAIRQQVGDKPGEGTTLSNIGAVSNSLGKYADAEKTLYSAIEILESLRPGLRDTDKISIFEKQAHTYRFLQQSLIAQNKINSALEVSDRAKARAFIELLASKQLEKPNTQLNIEPLTLQKIQNIAKAENATLVQYSTIEDNALYIWVVKPTGEIAFEQVDLKKSLGTSLKNLVTLSRKSIGAVERAGGLIPEPVPGVNQTKQLQKLYQILIKPIAQYLPKDSNARVIFVPQESLFLVPFPALQDEEGKYLIDKHTILTAPAIQVLELTHQQRVKTRESGVASGEVLVVGNPTMPKIPIINKQLIPLPGAEKESIQIADLFKTQAITGSKATETLIVQKMTQARIIHFATHGLLDDFKGLGVPGAIALAPSTKDDGFLTSGEILDMKLSAELVVLSACNTGGGDITSDGVIGLSRSLITAGVPSVIVSLWSVDDKSTASLMSEFYRNLQQNPDKAVALRQAMLATKKQYSNPLDWAAFTLIGEAN
jgi:tetratricopeptide (TPR) repeat protein